MKRYLVKFNRPLLIKIIEDRREYYKPVYGFFGHPYTNDKKEYWKYQYDHQLYSSYLAAIHEWSNTTSPEFTISYFNSNWIDNTGQEHIADDWVYDICSRAMEKLGLDFTTYVIVLDDVIGPENRIIKDESYMDYLVSKAESKEEGLIEKTAFLFIRPLRFSAESLWDGEEGDCHIYGVVTEDDSDEEQESVEDYLGYLAMCEEYTLAGITPSGFSTQDGVTWYKDGIEYFVSDYEIKEECRLCKSRRNLKKLVTVTRIPGYKLEDGVRDELIIDQGLYEYLLDISMF